MEDESSDSPMEIPKSTSLTFLVKRDKKRRRMEKNVDITINHQSNRKGLRPAPVDPPPWNFYWVKSDRIHQLLREHDHDGFQLLTPLAMAKLLNSPSVFKSLYSPELLQPKEGLVCVRVEVVKTYGAEPVVMSILTKDWPVATNINKQQERQFQVGGDMALLIREFLKEGDMLVIVGGSRFIVKKDKSKNGTILYALNMKMNKDPLKVFMFRMEDDQSVPIDAVYQSTTKSPCHVDIIHGRNNQYCLHFTNERSPPLDDEYDAQVMDLTDEEEEHLIDGSGSVELDAMFSQRLPSQRPNGSQLDVFSERLQSQGQSLSCSQQELFSERLQSQGQPSNCSQQEVLSERPPSQPPNQQEIFSERLQSQGQPSNCSQKEKEKVLSERPPSHHQPPNPTVQAISSGNATGNQSPTASQTLPGREVGLSEFVQLTPRSRERISNNFGNRSFDECFDSEITLPAPPVVCRHVKFAEIKQEESSDESDSSDAVINPRPEFAAIATQPMDRVSLPHVWRPRPTDDERYEPCPRPHTQPMFSDLDNNLLRNPLYKTKNFPDPHPQGNPPSPISKGRQQVQDNRIEDKQKQEQQQHNSDSEGRIILDECFVKLSPFHFVPISSDEED